MGPLAAPKRPLLHEVLGWRARLQLQRPPLGGEAAASAASQVLSSLPLSVSAGKSRRPISFLCAKARHHTSSIDKADGHLKRLKQDNREER